jgi:hypothetical protein
MLTPDVRDKAIWLVILLPGFVTIGTARLVSNLPGLSDFQLGILYFVATTINAGVAVAIAHIVLVVRKQPAILYALFRSVPYIVLVLCISVFTGIGLAIAYENAWANRVVRLMVGRDVLPKASPHDALELLVRNANSPDHFDDRRSVRIKREVRVLRIQFKNTIDPVLGIRAHWHSVGEQSQLYLSPACVEQGGVTKPIEGPGTWVSLQNVVRIDFLDASKVGCIQSLLPKGGELLPPVIDW